MVEIIKLVRTDFDNLENHNAICKNDIALFVGDEKANAHHKCSMFIAEIDKIQLYMGYDGEIYPKFNAYTILATEIEENACQTS
jgi:hypothetical protein